MSFGEILKSVSAITAAITAASTRFATAVAAPDSQNTPPAPSTLQSLLDTDLPALLAADLRLARARADVHRVDGAIIGTGAADFTTNNICYTLHHGEGKTFQLFDVPGIEGNEAKYAGMVRQAVAKAHLVIYVNGTNKKPEKPTAEKIRSYLKRGTQVCPIVNVRGNADSYEFDEDRVTLSGHGGCEDALAQTVGVLQGVLGPQVLMQGHCVQGLLGFSALAMRGAESTVAPARAHDLALQQRNYLKHFGSPQAMLAFSRMEQVADLLRHKLGTFRQDIVESNKGKVRELLGEHIAALEAMLAEHRAFLGKVAPEFDKCRAAVNAALASFERVLGAGRKNLWNDFFNELSEKADGIVADHFGDNDEITRRIKRAFAIQQEEMEEHLQAQLDEALAALKDALAQATARLVEDVRRVDFQQRIGANGHSGALHCEFAELDMDLSLKEWGSIAFNIGSYAASGATIGSVFPGIGTAIGAAVGAAVGLVVSLVGLFTGKEKRIRKAQGQVQEKIDEVRERVLADLPAELQKLCAPVRDEAGTAVLGWADAMQAGLQRPIAVIESQLALMKRTKDQLEKMPYGTIQTIQH